MTSRKSKALAPGLQHGKRVRPLDATRATRSSGRLGYMGDERGQSLVEFAFAVPLLLLFVVAIASFGLTYNHYLQLTDAVRVGGRAAATQVDSTSACSAASAAMQGNLGASDWNTVKSSFACSSTTVNGDPAVTVSLSWPYSINLLGISYGVGNLTSSSTERLG